MTSDTLNYTNLNRMLSECVNNTSYHLYLIAMTCAYSMDFIKAEIGTTLPNEVQHLIKDVTFSNDENEIVYGYDIYVGYSKIELRRMHDTDINWSKYDTVLAECFYSKIIDYNYGAPVQVVDNVETEFGSWGYNYDELIHKIPFDWRKSDPAGAHEISIIFKATQEEAITIEDIDLNKFLEVEI